MGKDILILGIESSCDETAASVVRNGRYILSNCIASQADFHEEYGGVVPELASRMHVDAVYPTVQKALSDAGVTLDEIDAVAVTHGPGLVGALLVGLSCAKGLCEVSGKPLVGVNHLKGHIAHLLLFLVLSIVYKVSDFIYKIIGNRKSFHKIKKGLNIR